VALAAPALAQVGPEPVVGEAVPEGSWFARDAWKCLGMFVVFDVVLDIAWRAIGAEFAGFSVWLRSGAGHFALSIVHYTVYILTTLYFARMSSTRAFLKFFGLDRSTSDYIWFAVVATLAIRVIGHFAIAWGWSRGVNITSFWGFNHSLGLERYLYLAPALMAPFGEELYMRGFLYRAFRGSYSVAVSTLLIWESPQ
jgi:hypothetical protein